MRERIRFLLAALGLLPRGAPASTLTLEQKLEILARGGLRLMAPFTVEELLRSWDRADYEKPGFDPVLVGLGMTEEQPPWRNHCINAWHFDTECIEDDDSYKRIAERMREMAQGSLPIENIRSHADLDKRSAWLEFAYRGKTLRIDCKVDDDWVDARIFGHFVKLLAESDPARIYLYYDLRGQDCVLACVTKSEFAKLKRSGVQFRPLT